jgi:hypothetical protein
MHARIQRVPVLNARADSSFPELNARGHMFPVLSARVETRFPVLNARARTHISCT